MAIATVRQRGGQFVVTFDNGRKSEKLREGDPRLAEFTGDIDTTPYTPTAVLKAQQKTLVEAAATQALVDLLPPERAFIEYRKLIEADNIFARPGQALSKPEEFPFAHAVFLRDGTPLLDSATTWRADALVYDAAAVAIDNAQAVAIAAIDALPDDLTQENHDAIRTVEFTL